MPNTRNAAIRSLSTAALAFALNSAQAGNEAAPVITQVLTTYSASGVPTSITAIGTGAVRHHHLHHAPPLTLGGVKADATLRLISRFRGNPPDFHLTLKNEKPSALDVHQRILRNASHILQELVSPYALCAVTILSIVSGNPQRGSQFEGKPLTILSNRRVRAASTVYLANQARNPRKGQRVRLASEIRLQAAVGR